MRALRRILRPLLRPRVRTIPPLAVALRAQARRDELDFWRRNPALISDGRREWFFTECFGIKRDWYRGKRVLDVGCGPRGSLDWASEARARVGLDPLAQRYIELGADPRAMTYVQGVAERMPFADQSFDVVASINSLDHVRDVDRAASEMVRVLRPGGLLLLATELNHRARLLEPQTFGWEILDAFAPPLDVVEDRRLADTGAGIDQTLADAVPYSSGPGVLVASLRAPQ